MQELNEVAIRQVDFRGDPIQVIEQFGRHYVAMKPICSALGLDWGTQWRNIKEDPVLGSTIVVTTTVGQDGKQREMVCLPIEYLNGWLFKIPAQRYSGERREKIVRYQQECYLALYEHFFKGGSGSRAADHLSLKAELASQAGMNPYARAVLEEDFGVSPSWDMDTGERYVATHDGLMSVRPRPTARKEHRGLQKEILELYQRGVKKAEIVRRYKGLASRSQIYRWLQKMDSEMNRPEVR